MIATDPHAARLGALHQTFTETAHELGVGILPPAAPPVCPVHGGLLQWSCRRGVWYCVHQDAGGFCDYEQERA